jgi:cytoskeletal protein CcmA (bactofilin family)
MLIDRSLPAFAPVPFTGVSIMKIRIVALAAVLVLGACGGGSMSGGNAGNSVGVTTSGVITAFGSVFVNGVRYDISAARLQKNGKSVAQSALAVGEVALVHGRQDRASGQGSAESVEVEDQVVGPVAAINVAANTLTVLGQQVLVTANTSFAASIVPGDLSGLLADDLIEVSGLADASGAITATRIGRAEAGETLQVLGTVAHLDATAHTFMINGLNVEFSTATLEGFVPGQPADADVVVVRGTVFDSASVTLTATAVQRADTERSEAGNGERVEQEGLVTRFVSATDFDVNGAPVTTTTNTVFEDGGAGDIAMNVRVEVRGMLDTNNVLVADVVEINHVAVIALAATVEKVDSANNMLQVLGVDISVDNTTRFEDKSSAHVQMFTLKDVNVGDSVLVRGFESPAASGKLLARRLERVAPSTEVEVRGPFSAGTEPQFRILGVTVDASNASFDGVEDHMSMSSAEFFAQAPGQVVEVRGTAVGDLVTASQVRIDNEDDR